MLKAFFLFFWVDLRSFKNRWKKAISDYVVQSIFIFLLLFLVSWILKHFFQKINNEIFFSELIHLLFMFLGTLWVFLAFTTNLSSLNYHHLIRFSKYPFTFRQIFIASLMRSLGDRWLLLFGVITTWIIIGMGISGPIKILIAISGCLVFALVMITYCQALKAAIDILGHSNMWGWVVKLLFGSIGFSIVFLWLSSSFNMELIKKYASFNPSLLIGYFPTGLLGELFLHLKSGEISKAIYDLLGIMGFLLAGGVVGYVATYQHIFNGGAHKSIVPQKVWNKTSLFEFLCNQVDKVEVLQKYAPIIAQELCYLIRSKKNQFLGITSIAVSILSTKTIYEWHPALIFLFPYSLASIRPSATMLNKYGQGIITYYFLPVSAYQAIIGTNLASFIFQCGILLLCISYPIFLFFSDSDIFITLSLFILQVSSIIYFISIGNFISLWYPHADVLAFSSFSSRDASSQAVRLMVLELIGYLSLIGMIVFIFYFFFPSSILMFCTCLLLLILGIALYITLLPKASQLQEKKKERIINTLLRETSI